MTAERDADALLLAQSDIVGLADIVERKQLYHQMMHAVAAGLDQREAVMPRVDVKEVGAKRLLHVVGKPEAEQVDVERHHRVDVFDRQHGVAKTERAGAETGNRTAWTERRVVDFRTVKYLQTIAGRIAKRNQTANTPVVSKRLRLGGNVNPGLFQPRRERFQRCRVGNLPAEEPRAVRHRAVDDDTLLAVVHPERQQ